MSFWASDKPVKLNDWSDAPYMFVEVVREGRMSKGLFYLAIMEHNRYLAREVDAEAQQRAAVLGGL